MGNWIVDHGVEEKTVQKMKEEQAQLTEKIQKIKEKMEVLVASQAEDSQKLEDMVKIIKKQTQELSDTLVQVKKLKSLKISIKYISTIDHLNALNEDDYFSISQEIKPLFNALKTVLNDLNIAYELRSSIKAIDASNSSNKDAKLFNQFCSKSNEFVENMEDSRENYKKKIRSIISNEIKKSINKLEKFNIFRDYQTLLAKVIKNK